MRGRIIGQGRDTAQRHISKGGWHPTVFPTQCLHNMSAGLIFTLESFLARLECGGEFTPSLVTPWGAVRCLYSEGYTLR